MDTCIFHEGTVISRQGSTVKVRILTSSACGNCHSQKTCFSSESSSRVIEIRDVNDTFLEGETVKISINKNQGNKAVFIAYFLPFLCLIFTLLIIFSLTHNQLLSALSSLLVLVPYYIIVFLCRRFYTSSFRFGIHKMNPTP